MRNKIAALSIGIIFLLLGNILHGQDNASIHGNIAGCNKLLDSPVNDNLSVSVGPSVFFGDQTSLGLQMGATYTSGNWSFSAGVRSRAGTSNYGPSSFSETVYSGRIGWYDGTTGVYGSYSQFLYGETQQSIAGVGAIQGDWSMYFENDFFARSGDKYRTHAMQLSYLDYSAGLRLYTGDASLDDPNIYTSSAGPNGTYTGPNAGKYRLGALSGGYKGFEAGLTSEGIRNATQNWWHDRKFMHTERFAVLKDKFPTRPYFQYSTSYNYTLW